ncbi:MAG: hypothetical protein KAS32_01015 [Candidatus Peribacteraceae bacterium]|nr:hypothetical protein [Candidatus Peribacteraceae bacterium]
MGLIQHRITLVFIFLISMLYIISPINPYSSVEITGGCEEHSSPFMEDYFNDGRKITYCENGDVDQLTISTPYFFSNRDAISFYYSGYLNGVNKKVILKEESGLFHNIILKDAKEKWLNVVYPLPKEFVNKSIKLIVVDESSEIRGWIGISEVSNVNQRIQKNVNTLNNIFNISGSVPAIVLIVFVLHLFSLTLLSLLNVKYSPEISTMLYFCFLGLTAYLVFFLYYYNWYVGVGATIMFVGLVFVAAIRLIRNKGASYSKNFHVMLLPASVYTLFIIFIGYFPLEQVGKSFVVPANRWLDLWVDNWLPKIFADQIWEGRITVPMHDDWLSSDRPPLQTGIYLLFYWISPKSGLLYQVLSSYLQAMIFLPIIVLLKNVKFLHISHWIIFSFAMTSLMAVNTLFVWPKIISAAYLIILYLAVFPGAGVVFDKKYQYLIIGASTALAMLSHGGAAFAILAIMFVALAKNYKYALGVGVPSSLIAMTIYLPWIYYQKYIDPPGDRLLKWHLAGDLSISELSIKESIVKAYGSLDLNSWFNGRLENIYQIVINGWPQVISLFKNNSLLSTEFWTFPVVSNSFYYMNFSMWIFSPMIALFLFLIVKQVGLKKETDIALLIFTAFMGLLIWVIVMFIPGSTVIHQGTYFFWIILFIASAILYEKLNPLVLILAVIVNLFIFLNFYVFDLVYSGVQAADVYLFFSFSILFLFYLSCLQLKSVSIWLESNDIKAC